MHSFGSLISEFLWFRGYLWRNGSARDSHHTDQGSIVAQRYYLIKITFVICEKSVLQFDSTKNRKFFSGYPGFLLQ